MTVGNVTARASDLVLEPSYDVDVDRYDIEAYDAFLDRLCGDRDYQKNAIRAACRFLFSGRYSTIEDLAEEVWDDASYDSLRAYYRDKDTFKAQLMFPGQLAASLDVATAGGKSFILYALARIALNEGRLRRVLVLCPSLTIEEGLRGKFFDLSSRQDLTDALPERAGGIRVPEVLTDANVTITDGMICVENVHAIYENTGSSLRDSFAGSGSDALILNDEAHHVYTKITSKDNAKATLWHSFAANPEYGFNAIIGVSGTCYLERKYEYFADVLYRYPVKDAIRDRFAKNVNYVRDVSGPLDREEEDLFEALWTFHELNKKDYGQDGIKPLTLVVTAQVSRAGAIRDSFIKWVEQRKKVDVSNACIVVTSNKDHEEGRRRLKSVDDPQDPTEFIFSVSMLTEGWDSKNVFLIVPHEERAFNSRLLISQVLGRGLRVSPLLKNRVGAVTILNHQKWAPGIQGMVNDVLESSETVYVSAMKPELFASHFDVDFFKVSETTEETEEPSGGFPIDIKRLQEGSTDKLKPQREARIQKFYVSDLLNQAKTQERVVDPGASGWPTVEDEAGRLLSLLRRDYRRDAELKKALYGCTRADFVGFITRSMAASGIGGQETLKETNQRIIEDVLRNEIFPPQGQLFVKRATTTREYSLEVANTSKVRESARRLQELAERTAHVFYSKDSLKGGYDLTEKRLLDAHATKDIDATLANGGVYKATTNMVVTSHRPEELFVSQVLLASSVARRLKAWLKSPDSGFYSIDYTVGDGVEEGQDKKFNPDFLLFSSGYNAGRDHIFIVEIKDDTHNANITRDKVKAAEAHVERLNKELSDNKPTYSFHLLTPADYGTFEEKLMAGPNYILKWMGDVHKRLRTEASLGGAA